MGWGTEKEEVYIKAYQLWGLARKLKVLPYPLGFLDEELRLVNSMLIQLGSGLSRFSWARLGA